MCRMMLEATASEWLQKMQLMKWSCLAEERCIRRACLDAESLVVNVLSQYGQRSRVRFGESALVVRSSCLFGDALDGILFFFGLS